MPAPEPGFYARPVVEVARDLIGCTVEHRGATGVIVETEAYHESEPAGIGSGVLIRALLPVSGIERMRARRGLVGGRPARDQDLCSGPGKLTQALGISLAENDSSLLDGPVRIHTRAGHWREPRVAVGTRIGITRAVDLRWRFCVAGNHHVSRPRL